MELPILLEDDALVVINKPPGIVVNRAESVKVETIQDWAEKRNLTKLSEVRSSNSVRFGETGQKPEIKDQMSDNIQPTTDNSQFYDTAKEFVDRGGIVHRIDKETSGILIIAKTPESFALLKEQFMNRTIHKTYQAIVHDKMPSNEGEIKVPIDRLPWNKEQFGVVPGGKESVTHYKVLGTYERKSKKGKETYQLIECYPKTGRTHQIRVHLKYLSRPILGDYLYAGRKTARDDREWVSRVMLHAFGVTFQHPVTKKEIHVEAPLPEDMTVVIQQLNPISLSSRACRALP